MNNTFVDVFEALKKRLGDDPKMRDFRVKLRVNVEYDGMDCSGYLGRVYGENNKEMDDLISKGLKSDGDFFVFDPSIRIEHDETQYIAAPNFRVNDSGGEMPSYGSLTAEEKRQALQNPDKLAEFINRECKFYERTAFGKIITHVGKTAADFRNAAENGTADIPNWVRMGMRDMADMADLIAPHVYDIANDIERTAPKLTQVKALMKLKPHNNWDMHPCVEQVLYGPIRHAGFHDFTKS